jgi:protease-4
MSALASGLRRQVANVVHVGQLLAQRSAFPSKQRIWLDLRLAADQGELGGRVRFGGTGNATLGLLETLRTLGAAAADSRIVGVVLRLDGELPGWSRALALRRAVEQLRRQGKRVVAWGEVMGAMDILVASACERVWMPVSGTLGLVGLRSEQFYLRDLLKKWEIEAEIVRIGRFKNAGEVFTRDSMSEEQREQIQSWQNDLFAELVNAISTGRGLEPDEVRRRIDEGPYPAKAAQEAGLIDACLYSDEIDAELQALEGDGHEEEVQRLKATTYYAICVANPGWQPILSELPAIAYVVMAGGIRRGPGRRGIASDHYGKLLDRLRERDAVCGVVLRVESPGGDAMASDLLYRAVQRLAAEKPVVVSMGNVAASGGYYLAAAAHSILAEAGTLTGSIGVVGGKLNLAGLYRRLGIAKDSVEIGARAGLYSEVRGFSSDERDVVVQGMEAVYGLFLQRVAEGRGLSLEAVEAVAEGHVWSGREALARKLVDALGGPLEAVEDVRRRAGLGDAERWNLELHPIRSPLRGLRELLHALTELE